MEQEQEHRYKCQMDYKMFIIVKSHFNCINIRLTREIHDRKALATGSYNFQVAYKSKFYSIRYSYFLEIAEKLV